MAFMAEHNPAKIVQFAHRVFDIPKSEDLEEMALAGAARLKHFFPIPKWMLNMRCPKQIGELYSRRCHSVKWSFA